MQSVYTTSRLVLNELALHDAEFISLLVNSPGWLKFIGDRNVHTLEDAEGYVQKIMSNADIKYWVVKTMDAGERMGIITFIKRSDLDYPDIGFAFLEKFSKQGFAQEATQVVLNDAVNEHSHILAITLTENTSSIRLLEKLGFRFTKEIEKDDETLLCYEYSA